MRTSLFLSLAALLAGAGTLVAGTVDIPIGFVPPAWVVASVRKTLSPQGKFVVLQASGTVRVTDSEDKIAEVYRVLDTLQKAPSLVSLNLGFVTYGKKTVERTVASDSGAADGFPFPRNYTAPKIVPNGNGYTFIPAQPSNFQGRGTGSTAGASRVESKTEQTKQVVRRLTASSVPEKPAPIPVLPKVDDVAGLQALALRLGAIKAGEPAWTAASTELLIRTDLAGPELRVTVTPQIVLPAAAGQEPRRIPIAACAATIPITRATPSPTGKLPRTDGDFYHYFLGTPVPGPDDMTALNLSGEVRFIGGQAP